MLFITFCNCYSEDWYKFNGTIILLIISDNNITLEILLFDCHSYIILNGIFIITYLYFEAVYCQKNSHQAHNLLF